MTTTGPSEVQDKTLQSLREEIERKTGKTPEQLYEEREKRVRDAIELKEPDRVPMWINPDVSRRYGVPHSAAYYDPVAWKLAIRQSTLDFAPDLCNAGFANSGPAWEALDVKNRLWPGGPLPPDYEYQFIEGEYMKEDEYDLFLSDPTDFMIRCYLPRMYGALLPFAKLPPLGLMFNSFEGLTTLFATPEFEQMARAISRAGREMKKFRQAMGDAQEEMALLGFPAFSHTGAAGIGGAPFDTISSFFRGMKGAMTDMWRQPEKLLQACDMILERRIAQATPADPTKRGNPKRVGMPLWRGDKMFMSDAQFKKFYWPGLKKAMLATIELGYVPMPFFEAHFGERLECLLELPKGKFIASVEHMDLVQAKEILGGHCCILGRGPLSLKLGSLPEIEESYKRTIDAVGKGGGFVMSVRLPDKGSKEDIKAMLDRIREYGRY
ncbi:uroporphyrinogen decarboxylase family protein [Chloroflexota bacterium]